MWHIQLKLFAVHHISFVLHRVSVKYIFPFQILSFFTLKSFNVTHRSVSQENALFQNKQTNKQTETKQNKNKKKLKPVAFSLQKIGLW